MSLLVAISGSKKKNKLTVCLMYSLQCIKIKKKNLLWPVTEQVAKWLEYLAGFFGGEGFTPP